MNVDDLILVSVDDHVIEPAHMFDGRVEKKFEDKAPRFVRRDDGTMAWQYCTAPTALPPSLKTPPQTEETALDAGIDADRLGHWLDRNDAPGHGEQPDLKQLAGGSQNLLYLVTRGDSRMILRMPGARA